MADSKALTEALRWVNKNAEQKAKEEEAERALSEAQDKADALVARLSDVRHMPARERATMLRKIASAEKAVDAAFTKVLDLVA